MNNGKDIRKAQRTIKAGKPVSNPYKDDVIYSNLGQWKYPGQVTRIPSNQITMQGVPYPVQGIDDTGYSQMMYPGMDYTFPGQYVTEYPMVAYGGDPSLPNIEGHYPFGGQNTKTHTHMVNGGWLDTMQVGGISKESTSVRKPNILNASELAYAQPHQKLSKEDQMAMYVDSAIANRQPDELRETKKQGLASKAYEVFTNPFTAATHLYQHGRIPDNFSQGETSGLDIAPMFINPAYYLEAAYNTGKAAIDPETYKDLGKTAGFAVTSLTGDQAPDEWKEAGLNTLFKGLDASMVKGAGKALSKNAKKIINTNINKTSKNIQKGLDEQASRYYQKEYGGDLEQAQWGKIIKAGLKGAKAVSKPVTKAANITKGLAKDVIHTVDKKIVTPIQFKKDIKQIKESASKQHEYFQKPEVEKKLKDIGASPMAIKALQTPNQVDVHFTPNIGSYFDPSMGIINIDMRQIKKAGKEFGLTPQQAYEHELGHQMQKTINIGSPEFQEAYSNYKKQLQDYTIRKQLDKIRQGKKSNLGPMDVRSMSNFINNLDAPRPPMAISKPTLLDKQAAGMLRIRAKDKKILTPKEKEILSYYHSEIPNEGISKIGYNIEHGTERVPHLREMRQAMIDKSYISDATVPITEDVLKRFIKENPKNRIAQVIDPTFQTNYKKLVKTFKHLPAALPIGLGAASLEEEYRRGGQKKRKYTSKNIQSSINDIMRRNETLFGPAGRSHYKPGLKYKSGGGWLDNLD